MGGVSDVIGIRAEFRLTELRPALCPTELEEGGGEICGAGGDRWGTLGSVGYIGVSGAWRSVGHGGNFGAKWDLWGTVGSMGYRGISGAQWKL